MEGIDGDMSASLGRLERRLENENVELMQALAAEDHRRSQAERILAEHESGESQTCAGYSFTPSLLHSFTPLGNLRGLL
eukprot:SAG31_NODE_1219_length_9302_cov_13.527328_9_plen_79_part_00